MQELLCVRINTFILTFRSFILKFEVFDLCVYVGCYFLVLCLVAMTIKELDLNSGELKQQRQSASNPKCC